MPTQEEVYEKIKDALVDALGVDDDEVLPDATLMGDLGAESIDLLDISFRLEKAFDIKISTNEFFPEDIRTNPQYVQDGKVTSEGISALKSRLPFLNLDSFAAQPDVKNFINVLTVSDMCRFVEAKL